MNVRLTIVTVCFNAEKTIKRTIESVLNQSFSDYEYVLIDGKSKDSTLRIIESFKKDFECKQIPYKYISEKDDGIYDAMNKGAAIAHGKWICFLNADDCLSDNMVLEKIFNMDLQDIDCICGDTICVMGERQFYRKSQPVEKLYYRNPFIHQSMICKTELVQKFKFDIGYKYSADFDQVVRMYLGKVKFHRVNMAISVFSLEGRSQKNTFQAVKEFELIRRRNGIATEMLVKRYCLYAMVLFIKNNPVIYRGYVWLKHGEK